MNQLSKVFVAKIAMTVAVWCGPLLLLPSSALRWIGFPVPEPQLFLRLLGMAYGALLVGYAFGLRASLQGEYPAAAVWMGLVSNGGAFLLLAAGAVLDVWAPWGGVARAVMWCSLLGTGGVTAALAWFGPYLNRPASVSS